MNRSMSVVVLAAIPVSLRSTMTSESLLAALVRRVARPIALVMNAARRLVRVDNEVTRAALVRDGFSIDQGRFRDGPPRSLDQARYDVLRQIR